MTIRTKLNLAIATTIAVFMVAATYAVLTVRSSARVTQRYLYMRGQSQLTADIRTDIYRHYAALYGSDAEAASESASEWPKYVLEDVEVQIRLAELDGEQAKWEALQATLTALEDMDRTGAAPATIEARLKQANRELRSLRHLYDTTEHELIASVARAGLRAESAIVGACVLAVLGFLVYVLLVRDWLVKPIEVLERAADTIGKGRLDHRVSLSGQDELADLGRRINAMAEGLARHQAALLETRELSAIGELCRNVAHGLRNPLAAIRASAQMAERRGANGQATVSNFSDVIEQVDRMDARITRLLEFSRPPKAQRDEVSFAELASAALSEARPLVESRGLLLSVEDGCGARRWRLDREQLASAIAELLTNAAHHSAAGGRIMLRGAPVEAGADMRLRIEVIDEGSGMPASTRDKAFGLFFTSRPQGTGVGLAMVKRVVERHNGHVELSGEQDLGTTVVLELPGGAATGAGPEQAGTLPGNGRGPGVLATLLVSSLALWFCGAPSHAATMSLAVTHINGVPLPGGPQAAVAAEPNDQLTVEIGLQGWGPQLLRGYQARLDAASLQAEGTGTLTVVGGSCVVDSARPDYAFAGFSVDPRLGQAFAVVDSSAPACRWSSGVIDALNSVSESAEVYLAGVTLRVPADAAGVFQVALDAGGTFLRDDGSPPGAIGPLDLQSLDITVGGECLGVADCADVDGNGIRDDNCMWWACTAGACSATPIGFADVGGPNGACPPDGATDGNDRFHVLNCFSNQDTTGTIDYPCEASPPTAFNVDAGGPSGACSPDGVCDGNDAFHALNVFTGISTCACPGGPAPGPPSSPRRRR